MTFLVWRQVEQLFSEDQPCSTAMAARPPNPGQGRHSLMGKLAAVTPIAPKLKTGQICTSKCHPPPHPRDVASGTSPISSYWEVLNEPKSHRDLIEILGPDAVAACFLMSCKFLHG